MTTIQAYIKRFREAPPSSIDQRKSVSSEDDFWWIEKYERKTKQEGLDNELTTDLEFLPNDYTSGFFDSGSSTLISKDIEHGHECLNHSDVDILDIKADDLLQKCEDILRSRDRNFSNNGYHGKEGKIFPSGKYIQAGNLRETSEREVQTEENLFCVNKFKASLQNSAKLGDNDKSHHNSNDIDSNKTVTRSYIQVSNLELKADNSEVPNIFETDHFFVLSPTLSSSDEVSLSPLPQSSEDDTTRGAFIKNPILLNEDTMLPQGKEPPGNSVLSSNTFYLSSSFESIDCLLAGH